MTTPDIRSTAGGKNHKSKNSLNTSTAIVTLLICCIGTFGDAEAADTWSPTGAMMTGRSGHTATLLSDLRHVLVTGGSPITASAEIYDSVTGTWSSAASMSTGRVGHTATALSNGRVLVAGGHNSSTGLASAEIYDPLANTWSPTASMSSVRQRHTATLLPNGRVLVAGGGNVSGALASAEIYDPLTGTWTPAGVMSIGRGAHTATLLLDGRVLVAGGENSDYIHFYLPFADIYDPVFGTWSPVDLMDYGRQGHRATRLAGGQVLVTGGFGEAGGLDSAELYDPTGTAIWSLQDSMTTDREEHTATLLLDGRVLVAGSFAVGVDPASASAETYDFDSATGTGSWSLTASMSTGRFSHTATRLLDGRVLVAGGNPGGINQTPLASAELFSYDSTLLVVAIDIKPNALPNSINLGSNGTVAVAIFSTPSFDATTVDPNSVTLASAPVKLRGQGTPLASFDDVNSDGLDDLVVHVSTQSFQLSTANVAAILEGMTFDGTKIIGVDSVRIVP